MSLQNSPDVFYLLSPYRLYIIPNCKSEAEEEIRETNFFCVCLCLMPMSKVGPEQYQPNDIEDVDCKANHYVLQPIYYRTCLGDPLSIQNHALEDSGNRQWLRNRNTML